MKKVIILIIILMILPVSCGKKDEKKLKKDDSKEKIVSVTVALAKTDDIVSKTTLTGTVEPLKEAKISAKMAGLIDRIFVKEGSYVQPYKTLIQLDQSDIVLSIKQSRAAVNTSKANLDKILAGNRSEMIEQSKSQLNQSLDQLANLEKDLNRMRNLYKDGIISRQSLDNIETQYKVSQQTVITAKQALKMSKIGPTKEDINLVKAQLQQTYASLEVSRHQLNNTRIKAPFRGIITKKIANTGEMASPGSPLLEMMDISTVKIKSDISENLIKFIYVGKTLEIKLNAYPDKKFEGTVQLISPTANAKTHTFSIEIHVPNNDGVIRPGMFARVNLTLDYHKNILTIPQEALFNKGEDNYVYIVKNNLATFSPKLKIGISDMEKVEILRGVNSGEKVVIRGQENLYDGIKVQVVKE